MISSIAIYRSLCLPIILFVCIVVILLVSTCISEVIHVQSTDCYRMLPILLIWLLFCSIAAVLSYLAPRRLWFVYVVALITRGGSTATVTANAVLRHLLIYSFTYTSTSLAVACKRISYGLLSHNRYRCLISYCLPYLWSLRRLGLHACGLLSGDCGRRYYCRRRCQRPAGVVAKIVTQRPKNLRRFNA